MHTFHPGVLISLIIIGEQVTDIIHETKNAKSIDELNGDHDDDDGHCIGADGGPLQECRACQRWIIRTIHSLSTDSSPSEFFKVIERIRRRLLRACVIDLDYTCIITSRRDGSGGYDMTPLGLALLICNGRPMGFLVQLLIEFGATWTYNNNFAASIWLTTGEIMHNHSFLFLALSHLIVTLDMDC
jgi:hypothetical protein